MKEVERPDSHEGKIQRLAFPHVEKNDPMALDPMESAQRKVNKDERKGVPQKRFENEIESHPDDNGGRSKIVSRASLTIES